MPSNYQIELKSWLRKLDLLQQENVLLKTRVAEILQNDVDRPTVDKLENYLFGFIQKDAILALLRRDVANEMKSAGFYQKGEAHDVIEKKQGGLRKDIAQMEFEFYKLKMDFSNYLVQLTHAA
ncbi:MAG TPA: hypothetical protein PL009_02050 [Flavipsychrobacter sp.]|nr:hypothetical protein [Flavipsychrobacter sp.]